jgi:hypothetical protein
MHPGHRWHFWTPVYTTHAAATSHHLLELRSSILPELLDKYLQVHGIETTASFERHASILQHAHRDSPLASDQCNLPEAALEQLESKLVRNNLVRTINKLTQYY